MTQTAPPASLRRRRIIQVLVLVVIVIAVSLPTWSWRSAVESAQVDVVPGLMACDGKPIRLRAPSGDDPGPPEYVVPIEKGMNCQFAVTVINHSGHTVRVKDMTFPALMPGQFNGGPVIVTGNDTSQKPHGHDEDLAATFDIDEPVASNESIEVDLRLLANPNACNSPGTATLRDLPATRVSVLNRQQTIQGSMAIAVEIKTPLHGPDCDSTS